MKMNPKNKSLLDTDIKKIHHEKIEWSYGWNEDSDRAVRRCLMIGDSLLWGSRADTYSALAPYDLSLSTFATSKGVNSPYLTDEIDLFCRQSNYDFDAVYFNNGLHSHGQSPTEYAQNYENVLRALRDRMPHAKWILGLSTPISASSDTGASHDAPIHQKGNEEADRNDADLLVQQYNSQVIAIAKQQNLPYFDAYTLMFPHGSYKIDRYHFNADGRKILGLAIAEQLRRLCGIQ